jgi:glyoxylase-like metal-dependent hydrolase (beta-lactamase superfamily II)/cell division septum initiation protein DivIVA
LEGIEAWKWNPVDMPDQNSAASEHAIMQQITQPLAELPNDPVGEAARVEFPIALRGYEREAVDEYVRWVTHLVAELHATRSPEGAVRRALERVGEQVSDILGRAHATAEQITSQSRAEAEERLMRARSEAEALERDSRDLAQRLEAEARQMAEERERAAEVRVRELDAEVDRIWNERDRIVADTRRLSEELAELASAAATRFPAATTDEAAVIGEPAVVEELLPALEEEVAGFSGDTEDHQVVMPPDDSEDFSGDPGDEEIAAFSRIPGEEPPLAEAPTSVLRAPRMRVIDLHHLGRERVIGCWQVDGVLIDPGPASCLDALLEALGDERPHALLLTHIHLDHAGATGSLVARWPELEVYVHERGAPHLIDPTRLLESAERLYGDEMQRLWGEFLAVPEENLRILSGGERLIDGRFEVAYTPGHASHHVSYLYEGTAFVGDVGGVRIVPDELVIPPTPPPDIDIEAWQRSIERVLEWEPERLAMTHFGSSEDVEEQLAELSERLDTWAALARTEDLETFVTVVESEIERGAGPERRGAYVQAAPPEQLYAGLERYWSKREADGSTAQASTHAGKSGRAKRST